MHSSVLRLKCVPRVASAWERVVAVTELDVEVPVDAALGDAVLHDAAAAGPAADSTTAKSGIVVEHEPHVGSDSDGYFDNK